MLEASGFDFRNRYPQKLLVKLAKHYHVGKYTVGKSAWDMSLDLYRTFAPLKQTTATMAVSCVELSGRLWDNNLKDLEGGKGYKKLCITRGEVMGMILSGLLDFNDSNSINRDASGSPRPLHPPPHIHHRRAGVPPGEIYQHSHHPQPGSIRKQHSPLHQHEERGAFKQRNRAKYHKWKLRCRRWSSVGQKSPKHISCFASRRSHGGCRYLPDDEWRCDNVKAGLERRYGTLYS